MDSSLRHRFASCLAVLAVGGLCRLRAEAPVPPAPRSPGKRIELACGVSGAVAHLFAVDPRSTGRRPRLRLAVHDPDAALLALSLRLDTAPGVLVDRRGPVRPGGDPVGFEDADVTPWVGLPTPPRGGPHRLRICAVLREGATVDRHSLVVDLLGGVFFDPVLHYEAMRDLSDMLSRRYRDLRDLDLAVRRIDSRGDMRRAHDTEYDHSGELETATVRRGAVFHLGLVDDLTFRSLRSKVDPVEWLREGVLRTRYVHEHWIDAPSGGRMAMIYQMVPTLYEPFDEVSVALARLREAYYRLAGLTEDGTGCGADEQADPLSAMVPALEGARTTLERLIEAARVASGLVEERAEELAGDFTSPAMKYPKAAAMCREGKLRPPRKGEPRRVRLAGDAWVEGLSGVGLAEGDPCCPGGEPQLRHTGDVRTDRLAAERAHLQGYFNEVRELAHHDLHLVRLWKALLTSEPPAALPVPNPGWVPTGGLGRLRAKVGGSLESETPGGVRFWPLGAGERVRRVAIE